MTTQSVDVAPKPIAQTQTSVLQAAEEEAEIAQLPWMIRLTIICLVGTILGWVSSEPWMALPAWLPWIFYALAYITGGFYSVQEAWETLKERQFDVNFLMIIAALGAAVIGQPREGAILMFLFSLSNTLETYAMGRTHASIRALLDMAPKEAEIQRGDAWVRVPVDELVIGDIVLVRPGAQVPADGIIVRGESAVNEASITGESMPIEKTVNQRVYAGSLNGQGALEVRVDTAVADSTLARIVTIVREAREQKAQSQDFTDRVIGQYYAYAVVGMTVLAIAIPLLFLGWDLSTTLYRAMTLMVVASPCALVISIPAALLSALASAARGGVLFKGGKHLEAAARIKVLAFDKTGTLTTGRPGVVAVIPVGGPGRLPESMPCAACLQLPHDDHLGHLTPDQMRLWSVAAAIEQRSEHPLARAVLDGARERAIPIPEALEFQSLPGSGASANVCDRNVRIGKPSMFGELTPDVQIEVEAQESMGRTVVLLGDEQPWGLIAMADTVRPEAAAAVAKLKAIGIERIVLLTGDNERVAKRLAAELGVDEVRAGLLPQEKVTAIAELQEKYGPTAMIGDGVNDAPALATANLGIAMGAAGTDVAIESADVLLMGDELSRLPGALELARRARHVIRQNLTFASAVIVILVLSAIFGDIALPIGVIGHEGSTLLVVANGLRLLVQRW
jgi:Cd2+/Zn2+-exporting ATPase